MADEKSSGGPPPSNSDAPPPPYTAGAPGGGYPPQGGSYPPQAGAGYPQQGGYPQQQGGYPQQQGGYPAQGGYQAAQSTVVMSQPGMGAMPGSTFRYGQTPAMVICQHCQATVTTTTSYETGLLTWAAAGMICLFMCWLGCCLIPFCVDASKDVVHTCPNCKQLVGKFRHFN